MPDNRIISKSKYVVNSIVGTATDNNLTKRSYNNIPISPSKGQNTSDSFNNTVHATISHASSNDDSKTFYNELENMQRLKSEENARLVQAKFNQSNFNHSNSNQSTTESEFHNKLSEAMDIEVDTSTLYKKVQLLNSLRKESNN